MLEDLKIDALITRWISDYRSRVLWNKFNEFGSIRPIDAITYDVPAPVLRQTDVVKEAGAKAITPALAADDVELRSWLMAELMRCLSNGRDTATKSAAGVGGPSRALADKAYDRTTLEEAVDILDRIVEETDVSDLVTHSDVSRLRLALKRQSVYVCCRAGKYDLSATVFERQWTHWKNDCEMDARREVSEVMTARRKDHPTLVEEDYEKLINDGRSFLRKAFSVLPVPFLVKAAHNVCNKIDMLNTTISADVVLNQKEVGFQNAPSSVHSTLLPSPQNPDGVVKRGRGRPSKKSGLAKSPGNGLFFFPDRSMPAIGTRDNSHQPKTFVREIKTERLEENLDTDTEIDVPGEHLTSTKNLPKKRKRYSSITSEGDNQSKGRRSSKVSWSVEDEELIFVGALKFGVGHWSEIARALPGRSNMDIKDKWCTMLKQGKVELYEKIHGLLPPSSPSLSLS